MIKKWNVIIDPIFMRDLTDKEVLLLKEMVRLETHIRTI
jgi:hypothetical protein